VTEICRGTMKTKQLGEKKEKIIERGNEGSRIAKETIGAERLKRYEKACRKKRGVIECVRGSS